MRGGGGGGVANPQIFFRGGAAPRSSPIPFYMTFYTKKGTPFAYLTNGTPFTFLG